MIVCVLGLRGVPRVMGGVETHCENLYPLLKKLRQNELVHDYWTQSILG